MSHQLHRATSGSTINTQNQMMSSQQNHCYLQLDEYKDTWSVNNDNNNKNTPKNTHTTKQKAQKRNSDLHESECGWEGARCLLWPLGPCWPAPSDPSVSAKSRRNRHIHNTSTAAPSKHLQLHTQFWHMIMYFISIASTQTTDSMSWMLCFNTMDSMHYNNVSCCCKKTSHRQNKQCKTKRSLH